MRFSDILSEMPTDLNKDAPFAFSIDGSYISNSSLSRDFNFLGSLELDSIEFKFWISKRINRSLITTVATEKNSDTVDSTDNLKNLIACDAAFNLQPIGDLDNSIQIDTVSTNSRYTGRNLAMIMYVILARYGYSVVSDFAQYSGGVGLWKTIARQSGNRKYVVRVWNIKSASWLTDKQGKVVSFDLTNVPNDKVWNKAGQPTQTLLVLTAK